MKPEEVTWIIIGFCMLFIITWINIAIVSYKVDRNYEYMKIHTVEAKK